MMKTPYFLLFMLLSSSFFSSQKMVAQLQWQASSPVAAASFGNEYPRLIIDKDEQPQLTWGMNGAVYFAQGTPFGFYEPVQFNTSETPAYTGSWTGPDLVSSGDTVYATFMHSQWAKPPYLVRSFDSGQTFSAPQALETAVDSTARFPLIALNADRQPIVAYMKMTNNDHDPKYVVRTSTDFGASFSPEILAGNWSGSEAEACDCCPATLKTDGDNVALVYRDNLNNLRDNWAGISTDGGNNFETGFAVDDSGWVINACPASGPDAVLIGDTLYTVFLSDGACFLSKTSLSSGAILSLKKLGENNFTGTQNYPRIDNFGNRVAITWHENQSGNQRLRIAYTSDIVNIPLSNETIFEGNFYSADVAVSSNLIYTAWQNSDTGTLDFSLAPFENEVAVDNLEAPDFADVEVHFFPNPASDFLHFSDTKKFNRYHIFTANGKLIQTGKLSNRLDISVLPTGLYFLELENLVGKTATSSFQKK